MKNLKISMKLFIGFGSILAMFVACVIFATFGLRSISNNLDQFYQRPFANVALAIQADMDSEVAAKFMLRACLEVGSAETSEMLDKATEYMQDMKSNLNSLKEKYSGNQSDITAVEALIDELEVDFNTYAELARANRNDEAYAVYKAEIVGLLTDITDAVGVITTQANSFATTSHDEGMASSKVTIVVMIVAGVLAVLIGVALALYITKALTSAIAQLKDASQRMSEGDFDAKITYESKDELGVLADSMKSLIENIRGIIQDVDYCLGEMGGGNFAVDSRNASAYVGGFRGIL